MTVRDLIKELESLPMDLPVVTDLKEIQCVTIEDSFYLDNSLQRYYHSDVVVLS